MAGDVIKYGFGASVPQVLQGSAGIVLSNVIPSAPGRKVALRSLMLSVVQVAGAAVMPLAEVGVTVLRAPQAASDVPIRPITTPVTGIISTPVPGIEILATVTYRMGIDLPFLTFSPNDVNAQDGYKLIIIVSPLIDASAMPHLVTDNGSIGLTSAGDDIQNVGSDALAQWQYNGQPARARSMPRYAVALDHDALDGVQ